MFLAVSIATAQEDVAPTWTAPLPVRTCPDPGVTLPAGLDKAMAAAVVLRSGDGIGSGVMVSPDGYLLTAAHVVEPGASTVTVVLRGGGELQGAVIRTDRFQDLALVYVGGGPSRVCLPVAEEASVLGTDLFAIGSPLGEGLEFTISKGVVSGIRAFGDHRFLQTDASINKGNSGGPLLDTRGHVAAIVSWKIAAPGFEGLAFGVPTGIVSERLGIAWGSVSEPNPQTFVGIRGERRVATARILAPPGASGTAEPAEPAEPSELEAGLVGAVLDEPATRKKRDDGHLLPRPFFYAGIGAAAVGGMTVLGTWGYYLTDPDVDAAGWRTLQTVNSLGWGVMGGGAALTIAGIF